MRGERTWDWGGGPRPRRRWPDDGRRLLVLHGPRGAPRTVAPAALYSDRRSLGATYNPMLGCERPRTVHPLRPRIAPAPGVALVLQRDDGGLRERMPGDGSLVLGVVTDVRTVYRVDVSEHALGFEFELPCMRDPRLFIADVDLTCFIAAPVQVVERRLTDVRRLLEPGLEELMRDVSGRFAVDDRAGAERELRRELRDRAFGRGFDAAVRVRAIAVRVRLDEATAAHPPGCPRCHGDRPPVRRKLWAVDSITLPGLPFPLHWRLAPERWRIGSDGSLSISAGPGTDLFVDPQGAAPALNAPFLAGGPAGDFQLSARVTVDFAATYDAGVLLLHGNDRVWAKLCFERSPQGEPMVVSVVTRGVSDDANAFVVEGNQVWLRISRMWPALAFHASTDGSRWRFVRHFALEPAGELEVGFEAQSPTGSGCTAVFDQVRYRAERLSDLRSGV